MVWDYGFGLSEIHETSITAKWAVKNRNEFDKNISYLTLCWLSTKLYLTKRVLEHLLSHLENDTQTS